MKELAGGGLGRLGVVPLIIPVAVCAAIFVIATQMFDLPIRNWAIVTLGLAAIWYWLLWLGIRRAAQVGRSERSKSEGPAGVEVRSVGAARLLGSPGAILSALLGGWRRNRSASCSTNRAVESGN